MSQIYVPGPVQIFVSTGASAAFEFLGWTEGDTVITPEAQFEPVMTDLSGPAIPFDMQFMGEHAFATGTLVKYNETVWLKVAARLNKATQTPGVAATGDVGSLMRMEGLGYSVVFKCPYSSKAAYSSSGAGFGGAMVAIYNFPAGWLEGAADVSISMRHKRQRFQFHFIPNWNASDGSYTLWNQTLPTLPALN